MGQSKMPLPPKTHKRKKTNWRPPLPFYSVGFEWGRLRRNFSQFKWRTIRWHT
jgi:hypothetical protein